VRAAQGRAGREWRNHLDRLNSQRARRVARSIPARQTYSANSGLLEGGAQDSAQGGPENLRSSRFQSQRDQAVRAIPRGVDNDAASGFQPFDGLRHHPIDFSLAAPGSEQGAGVYRHPDKTVSHCPVDLTCGYGRTTAGTDQHSSMARRMFKIPSHRGLDRLTPGVFCESRRQRGFNSGGTDGKQRLPGSGKFIQPFSNPCQMFGAQCVE
jgi:hypothetical protein